MAQRFFICRLLAPPATSARQTQVKDPTERLLKGRCMTIELDHVIVPSRSQVRSAKRLAELLGVPWAEKALGPFSAVYVNQGLTLDFIETDEAFAVEHFCFRVSEAEFDQILSRIQAAGIPYRSEVRGPVDRKINTSFGGKMIYWNEPDGHQWEILTVSYARPSGSA